MPTKIKVCAIDVQEGRGAKRGGGYGGRGTARRGWTEIHARGTPSLVRVFDVERGASLDVEINASKLR